MVFDSLLQKFFLRFSFFRSMLFMEGDCMTTGQRIKEARKKTGLTQKGLAEKLGIAYQTLAQWENDLRNPKRETLEKIAYALEISASYFLGYTQTVEAAEADYFEGEIDKAIHNVLEKMYGKRTEKKISGDGDYLIETINIYGSGKNAISIDDDGIYSITEAVKGVIRSLVDCMGEKPEEVIRQWNEYFNSEQYEGLCAYLDRRKQRREIEELKEVLSHTNQEYPQPPTEAPQTPPAPQESKDTTPPPEGAEGPQEGE